MLGRALPVVSVGLERAASPTHTPWSPRSAKAILISRKDVAPNVNGDVTQNAAGTGSFMWTIEWKEADAEKLHCEHEVTGSRVMRVEMCAARSVGGTCSSEVRPSCITAPSPSQGATRRTPSTPLCVLVAPFLD